MTTKTVAVVDYGMGNLRSVTQAVHAVANDAGVEVIWAKTPQEVMDAERVVLPGQGGGGVTYRPGEPSRPGGSSTPYQDSVM